MKKVFALVLAVAMVMSMTAVSFAADDLGSTEATFTAVVGETNKEVFEGITAVGTTPYEYNADSNWMRERGTYQYGKSFYFPLLTTTDTFGEAVLITEEVDDGKGGTKTIEYSLFSKQDLVEGLKVKADFEMGSELVESIGIVKKQVGRMGGIISSYDKDSKTTHAMDIAEGYYYFIEMKTKAKETTSDSDIVATFELDKSKKGDIMKNAKDKYVLKVKDFKVDVAVNVGYNNNYLDSAYKITVDNDAPGDSDFEPETYYLLKYDYDDEAEFSFGVDPNEGTFTVDVSGQGKNLLYFDTKIDEAIADANPTAGKLFALNFNNVKFNRTGEFVYEGEDFEYAYEVMADGSLKLLGEFSGEEVTFKTRVLGKYLFSDVELVAAPAAVTTPDTVVDVTPVENPTTGAAC